MAILLIHDETVLTFEWKRLANERKVARAQTSALSPKQHFSQGGLTLLIRSRECQLEQKGKKSINWLAID